MLHLLFTCKLIFFIYFPSLMQFPSAVMQPPEASTKTVVKGQVKRRGGWFLTRKKVSFLSETIDTRMVKRLRIRSLQCGVGSLKTL